MTESDKFNSIKKGLLEFAVLGIVSKKSVYAADILHTLSQTEFSTQEGTLYPLLSKLRREELVDYIWQESETGPPRKYYRLTSKGVGELGRLSDYWKKINETIKNLGASHE